METAAWAVCVEASQDSNGQTGVNKPGARPVKVRRWKVIVVITIIPILISVVVMRVSEQPSHQTQFLIDALLSWWSDEPEIWEDCKRWRRWKEKIPRQYEMMFSMLMFIKSVKSNSQTKIFHLFSLLALRKGCLEGFGADRVAACVSTLTLGFKWSNWQIQIQTERQIKIQAETQIQFKKKHKYKPKYG